MGLHVLMVHDLHPALSPGVDGRNKDAQERLLAGVVRVDGLVQTDDAPPEIAPAGKLPRARVPSAMVWVTWVMTPDLGVLLKEFYVASRWASWRDLRMLDSFT